MYRIRYSWFWASPGGHGRYPLQGRADCCITKKNCVLRCHSLVTRVKPDLVIISYCQLGSQIMVILFLVSLTTFEIKEI